MCDIAPFSMKCELDDVKHDLIACNIHHFCCAFCELGMLIPIIGKMVVPYECPDFLPKECRNEQTKKDRHDQKADEPEEHGQGKYL